ncbi:hypothetical protein PMG11_05411 [Penicillium brasilianum]|uniref:Uncharacterized protein n=1 Tax=Penicillium brasilianum TaxID=104259 RepID=A0A0F7VFK7_PENBI|nr:hypothetical protein PMG11_05411 [Penicillium brasilianum]
MTTPDPTQVPSVRCRAPLLSDYHPEDPSFVEIGDVSTVPKCHVGSAGSEDKQPGEWTKLLWECPWKVAREGEKPKGKLLSIFFAQDPARELMARWNFFESGKREEERIRDRLSNVESAFMYCLGEVQDQPCRSCLKSQGPWAKCVKLPWGTEDALACANCRWNGQFQRCNFWRAAQDPGTLAAADRGPRRNKPSITDDMAKKAFDELDRTRKVCYDIHDELDAAAEHGKLDVVKALARQLRTWADVTDPCHKMLRARFSPASPTTPQ